MGTTPLHGKATAFGKIVRVHFKKVALQYEPRDVVQAAVAIAREKEIKKETLKELLSKIRIDVSAFGWIAILPTWVRFNASSLLPLDRPLLGTKDRLLPIQLGAMPNSSFLS